MSSIVTKYAFKYIDGSGLQTAAKNDTMSTNNTTELPPLMADQLTPKRYLDKGGQNLLYLADYVTFSPENQCLVSREVVTKTA